MLQLTDRQSAHTLTVLSLLTLFSFVDIGNSTNRSFWLAVRAVGCGCAIGAVYGYRKADQDAELTDENGRLLEAVGEVKQGHDWEKYQLQLQHQREIEHYDRALAQLQHQLQQAQSANLDQIEAEKDKLTIAYHRLQQDREQLAQQNAQLDEHFAQQQQTLTERDEQFETTMRDRVAEVEAHLAEQQAQMKAGFESMWVERETILASEIQARDQLIADLETQNHQLLHHAHSLMQSDKTNGVTNEELLADRVIDYLHQHGIVIRSPQAVPYGKDKFRLSFSTQDIAPGKNDKKYATSLLESYKWLQDRLLTGIPGTVPGCKTKPEATLNNGRITLLIDVSGVDWVAEAKAKPDPIQEAVIDWLLKIATLGNHFRLTGPTDSGKSALADNLIGAMQRVWTDLSLTVGDPKYPFTEWTTFDPDYKGVEQCLRGMELLEHLIDTRFAQATADKAAGKEIREFPAELFALDEAEILMDEARLRDDLNPPKRGELSVQKEVTRLLRKGLKIGRGLTRKRGKGLKVLYIAQSPLCSRLGLSRDDFDQSVNLFIGENIPRALNEELNGKISHADRDFWLEQYHLRVARGDRYFCLVKAPGQRPFIATMPAPGTYAVNSDGNAVEISVTETEDAIDATETEDPVSPLDQLERLWETDSADEFPEDEA